MTPAQAPAAEGELVDRLCKLSHGQDLPNERWSLEAVHRHLREAADALASPAPVSPKREELRDFLNDVISSDEFFDGNNGGERRDGPLGRRARKLLSAPATPQPEGWQGDLRYIPDLVCNAMLTAWNEICSDTDCHPTDIKRDFEGRRGHLGFEPEHWARMAGEIVKVQVERLLTAAPSPAPGGGDQG